MTRLFFLISMLSFQLLSAQDKVPEGLLKWQDQASTPFERILGYTDYIWTELMFSNPDSAYFLLKEVEVFANKQEEIQGLGYVLNQIGVSHGIRGNLSEASASFRLASEHLLTVGDFDMYVSVMENLAHSYEQGGLLSKALSTLKKTEVFSETYDMQYAKNYVNEVYGSIYLSQGNLPEAKKRFYKAIELYGKDSIDIGTNYKYLGDVYQKENKLDSALICYQKSLDIHNQLSKSNACQTALSMAKLYFKIGNISEAKAYLDQALSTSEALSLKDESTGAHLLHGQIANKEGQLDLAIKKYKKALEIAKEGNHLINQQTATYELYQLHKTLGNTSVALAFFEASKMLSDSIKNDDVKKQLQLLDYRNQVRQDSLQLANVVQTNQLKYESSLQQRNQLVFILLFIALGLIAFAYTQFKAKRTKETLLAEVQEQHQKVTTMNKEIVKTKDQLVVQEKLASLGQLTAGIAHEIKNPLNFITNFSEDSSELIQELDAELKDVSTNLPPNKQALIQTNIEDLKLNISDILKNGIRVDQIVNNMMNHARESELIQILEDVNILVDINVNFAFKGFKAAHRSYTANIIKELDPGLPKIKVYPQDFGRVIVNLINNACYATQIKLQNETTAYIPEIKVRTSMEQDYLKIVIRDNGIGVSQKIQQDIFNPFFTTKPTGEGNTGLGLSISFDIISNLHKGQLIVNSKEGNFAEFTILIPKGD